MLWDAIDTGLDPTDLDVGDNPRTDRTSTRDTHQVTALPAITTVSRCVYPAIHILRVKGPTTREHADRPRLDQSRGVEADVAAREPLSTRAAIKTASEVAPPGRDSRLRLPGIRVIAEVKRLRRQG